MSSSVESAQRFFRPPDAGRVRRNYRRVQVQRLFAVARNLLIAAGIVLGIFAAYRHTQSGAQFAVRHIEIDGARHTPRAALDAITSRYAGTNLFKVDIARVRRDLGALPWVRRVDIEEKVPDTLRIKVVERTPAALVLTGGPVRYVDDDGVTFAELSPSVGDPELPVISNAHGTDVARCVALLRGLRARDPHLYARVSEVRPVAPRGFAIFDRQLGAFVYTGAGDLSAKWRDLYAIAEREQLGRGAIEYADLRFADRIIVKTWKAAATPAPSNSSGASAALQD
jgi:cell division protein FtsQ